MTVRYDPDPFVKDPDDAPEAERAKQAISALKLLISEVRRGNISEDQFFARKSKCGLGDLDPRTGRHWLWRVHHRHNEVWKCIGRPNWSVRAYAAWRSHFYKIPLAERFDKRGHPRLATIPKRAAKTGGLRHEHVVPMGLMLKALLEGEVSAEEAMDLNEDAIITVGEDHELDKSGHPNLRDPWRRYAGTGIRFIPNPSWSADHQQALRRHGLVATPEEVEAAFAPHPLQASWAAV